MPPAVAGIALLAAFGPHGILGGLMNDAGIELVFETPGVVVALIFVSVPFFLRQAIAAFAAWTGDCGRRRARSGRDRSGPSRR
jgi:molybdate transport system permease protein